MGSYQFMLDFTRPICARMLELQDDVGFTQEKLSRRHEFAHRSIAAMTHSSPTSRSAPTNSGLPNPSSAVASPSTQTVNTTVTTPPIRNSSKHDIAQSSSLTKVITELQAPEQSAESNITTNGDGDSSNADGESNLVELPSQADAPVMSVDVESNQNGLMFCPSCSSLCMTKSMDVTNPCKLPHNDVIDVVLNNPGNYVIFPASTYHRGYYKHHSHNTFLTAQFFSNYKSRDGHHPIRMIKSDYYHSLHLDPALVVGLFNDLRHYWDTYYFVNEYGPPEQYKLNHIDQASNRVVQRNQIENGRPFLRHIVSILEQQHPYLEVQTVWFIRKSNDGDGFQTWHKDLVNNGQINLTIVLNTGSYVELVDTDDDGVDSASALDLSKSPPYFFLDGSELAYYNLDNVPP
jgi:hypothetical protein